MKRWHEFSIGRWCAMIGPSVAGLCYLICVENTVVLSAQSPGELIASVVARLRRAF
jgi:hypothetical protein